MREPDTQRLFFALWPGGRERQQLEGYYSHIRNCGGRKVALQKLHLTLAFLGNVLPAQRDCLLSAAEQIVLPRFTLQLDQLGYWRRPQVLWLGCEEAPEGLLSLVSALNQLQRECGLTPDSRPFRTHLTLLRRAHRPPRQRTVTPLSWPVKAFSLVASETRSEGAVYETLKSWELSQET